MCKAVCSRVTRGWDVLVSRLSHCHGVARTSFAVDGCVRDRGWRRPLLELQPHPGEERRKSELKPVMPALWFQGCCDAVVAMIMMPRSGKSAVRVHEFHSEALHVAATSHVAW